MRMKVISEKYIFLETEIYHSEILSLVEFILTPAFLCFLPIFSKYFLYLLIPCYPVLFLFSLITISFASFCLSPWFVRS